MGESINQPYADFGHAIKELREKAHESLEEVSGAVEVSRDYLTQLEKGEIKPSEDLLILLINHFKTAEQDAARLWEKAGYTKNDSEAGSPDSGQPTIIISQADNRIVYTDVVNITANNYGVVMNFMQNAGSNGSPLAVARIGMSHEHAKSVLELLKATLDQADKLGAKPKHLPSGEDKA